MKNEEKAISKMITSLISQSKRADEIIIVDAGSSDRTAQIIQSYIEKGYAIKLLIENGANVSRGLNIAIKHASYDIIACVHSGCQLDQKWLESISRPFLESPHIDVVAGWYEPDIRTNFEKCVAELTCPKLHKVLRKPECFLPSSRSIAFRKKSWQVVGGFPEWLDSAEDTFFSIQLKKMGHRFSFAPSAKVYWRVSSDPLSLFKQYYLYAKGDAQARLFWKHYCLLGGIYGTGLVLLLLSKYSSFIAISLLILAILYFLKDMRSRNLECVFWSFIARIFLDVSKIVGFAKGLLFSKPHHSSALA